MDIRDESLEVDLLRLDLEPPGLDLREVQHIVEQAEKVASISLYDLEPRPRLRGGIATEHQVGVAQDRGERCPKLVAQVGQKLALGPVLGFRPVALRSLSLRLVSRHGIPHRSGQARARELRLDEVVGGAGTKSAMVDLSIVLPRQHDDRSAEPERASLFEEGESIVWAEPVVEEADVMRIACECGPCFACGPHPIQVVLVRSDLVEEVSRNDVVVLVVLYEKEA